MRGSSSPSVVPLPFSDPAGVDPEAMLIASVASCHMLWFLSITRAAGWDVDSYTDDATGLLARNDEERLAITRIILRPAIVFAGNASDAGQLSQLHHQAHERCFIAKSLKCEITVEPPR